jgi:hypothetical protein
MARGAAVRVRRVGRAGVHRPDRVAVRADSVQLRVPLEAFRFEDDASPGKSKGELSATAIF